MEDFLYDYDSELYIPMDRQYFRIYYQDDDTTTVMDTGENQYVLNGRCLHMVQNSLLAKLAGLVAGDPPELHSAMMDALMANGLVGDNEQYRTYSPQNKGCSTDNPFVIYSDKHYVRLEFAIMNLLQKWYPARKEYITLLDQAIIYKNGRTYDLLRYIVTSGNDTHYEDYYFDITNHLSDED